MSVMYGDLCQGGERVLDGLLRSANEHPQSHKRWRSRAYRKHSSWRRACKGRDWSGRGVPGSGARSDCCHPDRQDGAGDRRSPGAHRCSTSPTGATARTDGVLDRTGRDRARGAAHPPLRTHCGAARLCPTCRAARSHDPGLLWAGSVGTQGRRGVAADPGAADPDPPRPPRRGPRDDLRRRRSRANYKTG